METSVGSWTSESGQESRRGFFATEKEALKAMGKAARDAQAVGRGWGQMSAPERSELVAVSTEICRAGLTLQKVWNFYQANAARMAVTEKPASEVPAELIAAKLTAQRRRRYVESLESYLNAFFRGREAMPAHQFTSSDIEAWLAARSEAPASRATGLTRLHTFFSFAVRRGYCIDNPCQRVERVTLEAKPPAILTVGKVKKALELTSKSKSRFLAWFVLAVFAGIRPEELDKLTWEAVDVKRGIVTVDAAASKVRQRRIVHLMPAAVAWLSLGGDLPLPSVSRRRFIRWLRNKFGFDRWPKDVLRHSAASYWLAEWQDAGRVALELGNSVGVLLRHYRELVPKEQADAFWSLRP